MDLRDEVESIGGGGRRETQRRLIEQQQARPSDQRPGDGQHLLFAAAQRPAELVAPRRHPGQPGVDLLDVAAVVARIRRPRGNCREQVLVHRQAREDAPAFGHRENAEPGDGVGGKRVDAPALERNLAGTGPHQPGDEFQQRRFARAVRAQQAHGFPLAHRKRNLFECAQPAVFGGYIRYFEKAAHVLRNFKV